MAFASVLCLSAIAAAGDIEFSGVGQTVVTSIDGVDILHNFTCIELKTGICTEGDLNQIIKYENWLVRKLAGGDSEMVQSILVGFDFQDRVLEYVQKRKLIEEKTVRLLKYRVDQEKQDITLVEE